MSITFARNIVVILHDNKKRPVGTPRHYARIDTALRKIGERIAHIPPGCVFAISHAVTGLEIGTVTTTVGGFNAKMIWENA